MKVAIIGAGFTGLAAAFELVQKRYDVCLLEKNNNPGGLATGFTRPDWNWSLEEHYHVWFSNDHHVLNLAKDIGVRVIKKRIKTSTLYDGKPYQLDNFQSLLAFPYLGFIDKLRTGLTLMILKLIPYTKILEEVTAQRLIKVTMGEKTWNVLWRPLFNGKFGRHAKIVSSSWFWARIKKRTTSFCYPAEGFLAFATKLAKAVKSKGGRIKYNCTIQEISKNGSKIMVLANKRKLYFDKVICTLPTNLFIKLCKDLPSDYSRKYKNNESIGAVNLVLSLKNKFLKDGTYWLNINQKMPILAVTEHTNFVNKINYGNSHILYVGNYLPADHDYFKKSANELLDEFLPSLLKINPAFNINDVIDKWVFKAPFAQPIVTKNYSSKIPPLITPINGIFLANMEQVYPWDRGTNYAVELGQKVAELI